MVTRRSFCRFCEAACAILVDVETDPGGIERVTRIRGDASSPLSNGYTCSKGRNLTAWHHHRDRLDVPLVRRPDGELVERSWDETLDDLADRLGSLVAEHGADSVGVMLATGSAFDSNGRRTAERLWKRLGSRSVYTSGSVDTPCKPFVARLVGGFPGLVPTLDERTARLTVLIGLNPVVSHGHLNGFPDPVVKFARAGRRRARAVGDRSSRDRDRAPRHPPHRAEAGDRPPVDRPPGTRGARERDRSRVRLGARRSGRRSMWWRTSSPP